MAEALALGGASWEMSIAGWVASPIIIKLVKEGFSYLGMDVADRMDRLEASILPQLQEVIDAANKHGCKSNTEKWLRRLKDAMYEVEDALDFYKSRLLRQKVKNDGTTMKKISNKLSSSLNIVSNEEKNLKQCLTKLEKIAWEAKDFRDLLERQVKINPKSSIKEPTMTTSMPPPCIFGRDADCEYLLQELLEPVTKPESSEVRSYSVFSIVGVGGAGKTTLAQLFYNHERVVAEFDLKIWLSMTHGLDLVHHTRILVEGVSHKRCPYSDNVYILQDFLIDSIKSKKILVILDDVRCDETMNEQKWEQFVAPFARLKRGSKILVTSRTKNMPWALLPQKIMPLKELEDNHFISLFMHHAFRGLDPNTTCSLESLERIGKQIAKKLRRSPLAAKAVGSRLGRNLNEWFWRDTLERDMLADTMQSLLLSYQNLDAPIQRCFSYCAIFPKGYRFDKRDLILLWVAEGFIHSSTRRMEDVGNDYFQELLSVFFFQKLGDGEYGPFGMHDLFHDLAERVSGDDCFRIEDGKLREIPLVARHLSIQGESFNEYITSVEKLKNLRSVIFIYPVSDDVINSFLKKIEKFPKLRVLDFCDCTIKKLPNSVGELVLLRYLGLSKTEVAELPTSVQKLHNLQTLNLNTNITHLPRGLSKLVSLRHLIDSRQVTSTLPEIGNLTSLQNLPVGDSPVYGRENEKNLIIEYLLSDDFNRNNPTVVCIVGESGIGKTSIVHLIYSEERVLDSFDARIFITMPEKCDETRLLNKLIESITGFPCPMTEADLLEDLLIDELSGTKVFVVLDDADNENPFFWNRIVTILNHSSRGSVLLVTTKSKDVAEVMGAMQTYYLDPLSDYYCWKIFWQHISTGLSINAICDLVEMGKRLVSMCQHNPLGIKVLAGLLVSSKNEESLVEILKTDLWEKFGFDADTLPILRVGYELLPDNLKKCLHYCSLFPKDYVFAKQQSVRMWMSQGFINPVEGRQPEEVGLQNFDELLLRGFFRHSPVHDVEEDKFIMHDIIRALATNLSRIKYPPADDALERIFDNCFHFSLNPSKVQMDKMKPLNSSDLQSFLALTRFSLPERIHFSILDLTSLTDLFTKCINLRTLDLSGADIVELTSSVGMLKQLRYLGVNNTKIRSIPRELCSLVDLQTLEAKDCQHLVELPESMMELKNLRHLDVSKKSGCVKMMNGIGQLTNLQSLAYFCVGSEIPYCSIRELKDLNCLSSCLQIAGLENIRNGLDAKEAALHNKVHLNTLWLHWNDNRTCTESEERVTISEEVLNNLKPNPQIAELIIRNYGGDLFPTWMGDPSMLKLVSIILDKCLNCSQFPALGGLPSLRHLSVQKLYHLVRLENTDNQFSSKNTPKFPSLETLNLWEMYNLEELFETSDRDFPCLRILSINRCPMLKKIPCFFSLLNLSLSCCVKLPYLPNLPSLESLTIVGFQKMKSLELPKDLPALKKLEIRHCNELLLVEGLPELLSLEKLNIVQCHCLNFDSFKSWKPCHPKSISTTSRFFFTKEKSTTHVEHEETSNLAEMLMAEDTYKGI